MSLAPRPPCFNPIMATAPTAPVTTVLTASAFTCVGVAGSETSCCSYRSILHGEVQEPLGYAELLWLC